MCNVGCLFVRGKNNTSFLQERRAWEKISSCSRLHSHRIWPLQINCINCKLSPLAVPWGSFQSSEPGIASPAEASGAGELTSLPGDISTASKLEIWCEVFQDIVGILVFVLGFICCRFSPRGAGTAMAGGTQQCHTSSALCVCQGWLCRAPEITESGIS